MRLILETFSQHVNDVEKLIAFDSDVIKFAIDTVDELHHRLVDNMNIDNAQMNGARTLEVLKGIRDHGSLKPRFSLILNQAVVLLVSYFGSAVEDIFSAAITTALSNSTSSRLMKEDMKLTVSELMEVALNQDEAIVNLFIEKKDLSFQDMQAIHRAFRDYVGVEMQRDSIVNNIILAQACRHVIVHAGGEVSSRLIRQVKAAHPRDLKSDISEKSTIQFSIKEINIIGKSMKEYLSKLVQNTELALEKTG